MAFSHPRLPPLSEWYDFWTAPKHWWKFHVYLSMAGYANKTAIFSDLFLEVSVYMDLTVSISNNIALLNRNYIQGLCSAQTYNLNEIPFLTRNISFRLTVCCLLNFKCEPRPAQVSWVIHVSKKVATLQKTLTNWLSHGINIWLYPTS